MPYIKYNGFHCGCCGTWIEEEFTVPKWDSAGWWWDTIGLCNGCKSAVDLRGNMLKRFFMEKR